MKQCLVLTITGKVSGIGYREFVQKEAKKLAIEGTAQRKDDETVIVHACGTSENLDQLVDALYKGPKGAEVKNILAEPLGLIKDFRGVFRIIGDE